MRSFEYYTPTKVIFGKDTHLKIGEILKDYNCHKILIHYGGKSAVKSGLIDDIKKWAELFQIHVFPKCGKEFLFAGRKT